MALMRGNPYIYPTSRVLTRGEEESGYAIHCGGDEYAFLETESAEEFAVMVVAKMDEAQKAAAMRRVVEKHGMNLGAVPLMKLLDLPNAMDWLEAVRRGE